MAALTMSVSATSPASTSAALRRKILWPLLVAGVIFAASSRPSVAAPGVVPHIDKIGHFLVYGLLGTLVVRIFFPTTRVRRAAAFALLITSAYGASDEFHQRFTPGRSSELLDWVADTSGAALAIGAYAFWSPYRRLLEHARPPATAPVAP